MSQTAHHESSRSRHPITIVSTEQGPRVGRYIFGKTLGTGSTGKVKLAKNLDSDEIVAIKIVRKDYLDNKPSLKKKMRREISVLKVLSHRNLMSLLDVFEIETHLFLVMEFVDGLELFEYLVRRGALPIPQALSFFQQIICGLEYCHHRLICHRDLKPENILLDRNLNIKIADFGMTSLNPPGSLLETSCGSPHYCDPMVVSGGMYDGLKADIWSCGVILYAMVTGRLPFDDDNIQRLLQKVQVGQYHLPSDLPKDLRDLIKQMLTVDPEQRISLEGIKAHPWFKSIPPKNYIEDTFVPPSDPVIRPDPMILRSLVDLGWGDAKTITTELAKPGPSMEKVFYQQLERHPMFRRAIPVISTRSRPEQHSSSHRPASSTNAPSNSVSDSKHSETPKQSTQAQKRTSAKAAADEDAVAAGLKAIRVDDDANGGEDGAAPDESGSRPGGSGNLVRQSSLRQGLVAGKVKEDEHAEQAIQRMASTNQRSWFDSMRGMWSGQSEPDYSDKTSASAKENNKTSD